MTSAFSVSGIPLGGGTVALDTASAEGFGAPVVVADGMLVGVTEANGPGDAMVGYRLADGARQWLVHTPNEVHDVALRGSDLVFVDGSHPAYSLEEVSVATGTLRSLGYFTHRLLQPARPAFTVWRQHPGRQLSAPASLSSCAAIKASAVAG